MLGCPHNSIEQVAEIAEYLEDRTIHADVVLWVHTPRAIAEIARRSGYTGIIEAAGGMAEGHVFKAYQPGGPSSGLMPAALNDVPLDFDTLQPHGSFIGSAAVVVLSDKDRAQFKSDVRASVPVDPDGTVRYTIGTVGASGIVPSA